LILTIEVRNGSAAKPSGFGKFNSDDRKSMNSEVKGERLWSIKFRVTMNMSSQTDTKLNEEMAQKWIDRQRSINYEQIKETVLTSLL
jgi:hypothetical protein